MSNKDTVVKFLKENEDSKYIVNGLAKKTRLSTKAVGNVLYTLFKDKENTQHNIKRRKVNGSLWEYWCENKAVTTNPEPYYEEIPRVQALLQPSPHTYNNQLSDIVARVASMEQRLQMYEQAMQSIASIVEQIGYLEEIK